MQIAAVRFRLRLICLGRRIYITDLPQSTPIEIKNHDKIKASVDVNHATWMYTWAHSNIAALGSSY